jgi:glutamate:GABA antiporter
LIVAFILLSMLGVGEQEANQVLSNASTVHYGIAYVALFLLPLVGSPALRRRLPGWLKLAAIAGFCSSLVSVAISVYPIIDVVSPRQYAAKIGGTVIVSNLIGLLIYGIGMRRPQVE